MKRWALTISSLCALAAFCGCLPEKRVVWSPDGRWAAVIGGDGLYLSDADGKLSPRIVEDVRRVAWLPDSKRLVVVREEVADSWEEMAATLTDERREELIAIAERVREEVLVYEGNLDDFEPKGFEGVTSGEGAAIVVYLREKRSEGLAERLGEEWEKLASAEIKFWMMQLVHVSPAGGSVGAAIVRTPDDILTPHVSPDGKAVAFVGPGVEGDFDEGRLHVVPIDGGVRPRVVAQHVGVSPDWSVDGRYLVFARTSGPVREGDKDLKLGAIARRAVCDESGALLEEFGETEDLAGVVFQFEIKVRCLKDGRILFSTMEVHLPCTAADMPDRASLFSLHPGQSPVVTRVVSRQSERELLDAIYFFEVSPDERHVAIAGSEGELCVLTLATGEVRLLIDEDDTDKELRMVPTWRGSDELCCAVRPEREGERAAVALLKVNGDAVVRVISRTWPDPAILGFLLPEDEGDDEDEMEP